MLSRIVSFVGSALQTAPVRTVKPVSTRSDNPFANPFVGNSSTETTNSMYGKNKPVMGGYFAGYYNGKPNIVGKRLFIEV